MTKRCYIIAGPNGAGKTTFAKDFLPDEGDCINFINADLIAAGLSPFAPEKASIHAGKLMLKEISKCVTGASSFAFETTLSGTAYLKKMEKWKELGYEVILYYFSLPSPEMAVKRVQQRVLNGGHSIPEHVIERRFQRSLINLETLYKSAVDVWVIIDTSENFPTIIETSENHE